MQASVSDFWQCFGIGEREAGRDYSWIEVQRNLDFIGFDDTIIGCTLFYASRGNDTLLIRTRDNQEYLWDISHCKFSVLALNGSILVVSNGHRVFHLSGVTSTFMDLLMRPPGMHLPLDQLEENRRLTPMPIKIVRTQEEQEMPDEVSVVSVPELKAPVIVTGTGIAEEFRGVLKFVNESIVLDTVDEWRVELAGIESVMKTHVGRLFVVIVMKETGARFEIGFEDADSSEGARFHDFLVNEIKKNSS